MAPGAGVASRIESVVAPITNQVSSSSWRTSTTVGAPCGEAPHLDLAGAASPCWNSPTTGSVKPDEVRGEGRRERRPGRRSAATWSDPGTRRRRGRPPWNGVVVVVSTSVVVVLSVVESSSRWWCRRSHRLVVVVGEHQHADHDGHDGGGRPQADQQALAVVGTLGFHELLLDSGQAVGRRLDAGRAGFDGLAQAVLRGHRRSSSRSARRGEATVGMGLHGHRRRCRGWRRSRPRTGRGSSGATSTSRWRRAASAGRPARASSSPARARVLGASAPGRRTARRCRRSTPRRRRWDRAPFSTALRRYAGRRSSSRSTGGRRHTFTNASCTSSSQRPDVVDEQRGQPHQRPVVLAVHGRQVAPGGGLAERLAPVPWQAIITPTDARPADQVDTAVGRHTRVPSGRPRCGAAPVAPGPSGPGLVSGPGRLRRRGPSRARGRLEEPGRARPRRPRWPTGSRAWCPRVAGLVVTWAPTGAAPPPAARVRPGGAARPGGGPPAAAPGRAPAPAAARARPGGPQRPRSDGATRPSRARRRVPPIRCCHRRRGHHRAPPSARPPTALQRGRRRPSVHGLVVAPSGSPADGCSVREHHATREACPWRSP